MDNQMKELIAVGASITANCQPCLKYHVSKARECGADEDEIVEAMKVAKMVRKGAMNKMDRLTSTILNDSPVNKKLEDSDCGCGS